MGGTLGDKGTAPPGTQVAKAAQGAAKHARLGSADAEGQPQPKRLALGPRRQVESLLSKWEAVRAQQVAEDEEACARAEPPTRAELEAQRQTELRAWHAEMAADPDIRASNPNFMPLGSGSNPILPGAWRERVARVRAALRSSDA